MFCRAVLERFAALRLDLVVLVSKECQRLRVSISFLLNVSCTFVDITSEFSWSANVMRISFAQINLWHLFGF